ncbi:MAG: polysaccharide deacetylase family protein [Vicinamibacterales bacterium]
MYHVRREKRLAAAVVSAVPHGLIQAVQGLVVGRPFIRAVNYHATPADAAAGFRAQLAFFREHYSDVTFDDLQRFLADGTWRKKKPGLILSFDDGYRDNATVAAPLLEEFGFTGWFFVPSQFIEDGHDGSGGSVPPKPCITVDQLRALADRHVIGCHTRTHTRLRKSVGEAKLREEIVGGRAHLESLLGRPVRTFCWVGFEEDAYSATAQRCIEEAGYDLAFMCNTGPIAKGDHRLQLERGNVEADYPLPVVAFQLSGLMDLLYLARRRRVHAVTHPDV